MIDSLYRWFVATPASDAPLAFTLAAPAIAFLAILAAWATTRRVARQKATIDLIEKRESSDYYRTNHETFVRLRKSNGFAGIVDPATDQQRADRARIFDYLNHYELVSLGIRRGVLDGGFYKRWMGSAFVRDWNAASDLIQRQRWKFDPDRREWQYDEKVYRHFESIACRWSREAIRLRRRERAPPMEAEAGGPADESLPDLRGIGEPAPVPSRG